MKIGTNPTVIAILHIFGMTPSSTDFEKNIWRGRQRTLEHSLKKDDSKKNTIRTSRGMIKEYLKLMESLIDSGVKRTFDNVGLLDEWLKKVLWS